MPLWLLLVILTVLFLFARWFVGVGIGAPYLPLRRVFIEDGLALARLSSTDVVVDLGSGDGRLLEAAAERGAHVIGYELNPFLVWYARRRLRRFGERAIVYRRNMMQADLTNVTVILLFQMTHVMPELSRLFKERLTKNARIVSFVFELPGFSVEEERGVARLYRAE